MNFNIFSFVFFASSLSFPHFLKSQNVGLQFHTGNKFSFCSYGGNQSYRTISNDDFRIGLTFGEFETVSCALLIGKNTIKSQTTNEIVTSTVELGYLCMELPVYYKVGKLINYIGIGPSLQINTFNRQESNNLIVRNSRMFKNNVLSLYGEITSKGIELGNFDIAPYLFFRSTVFGIENQNTDEAFNIHQLGVGAKFRILWQ
jgi:hypothetical protein